jgi:S1-C subfamily serine protease
MPTRRLILGSLFTAICLFGAGCTGGGGESSQGGKTSEAAPPPCRPQGDEKPAKAVLRCTESSVAYVKTEAGSGTGVAVEVAGKLYVLTNEHVVDPFDAVDVTIAKRSFDDLPVVGVDAGADIAVLGPLTGADLPAPLAITDGTDLERGDEVFLVGFPGEANADNLEVTIASGIVSRLREAAEFHQSYIQTDASIGGGQSGGPLFDGTAKLVGISGLSFADEFALALTGRDAREAMERIVKGEGDDYLAVPSHVRPGQGATSGALNHFDANDGQVLFLPAAPEDRTWHLTVDMKNRPVVSVTNLAGDEPLAVSRNMTTVQGELVRQLARARGGKPEGLVDPSAAGLDPKLAPREAAPGKFQIPVKADESALVFVAAPLTDSPVEVRWQSDLPLFPASRPVTEEKIAVGGQVNRVLSGLDTSVDVLVDLAKGQKVELHARAPQGDPGFQVYGPGRKLDHLTVADPEGAGIETYDDTEDGIYGLDAKTTMEADKAGTYRFRVFINDMSAVRVRFSVVDCATTACGEKKPPAEPATDGEE